MEKGGFVTTTKSCLTALLFLMLWSAILAAETGSGLTSDVIAVIRQKNEFISSDHVIMNALTRNKISDLVVNKDFLARHNYLFSHTIETKGITDQKSSGRCWLFAGLNVLRPHVIKRYKLSNFEFSQPYLFFWDKMEKANFFLESIIETANKDVLDRDVALLLKNPISDGGFWSYVVDLIEKYGVVPLEAMPETYNTRNSWYMNDLIARMLRKNAVELRSMVVRGAAREDLQVMKIEALGMIYRMLVLNLGEPPAEFSWRYENVDGVVSEPQIYTPRKFYREVVGVDIGDFVALINHPGKEYDRLYQFDMTRNIYDKPDGVYANLPVDLLKVFALESVFDDCPVWFACDIVPDKEAESGILSTEVLDYSSLYDMDFSLEKGERILYQESYGNHAMVFTGVDVEKGKPLKWLVEDSHGADSGHDGHWVLYDDWFDEYVYSIIVNRKYLSKEVEDILKQEPIHLPPWEPMVLLLNNFASEFGEEAIR